MKKFILVVLMTVISAASQAQTAFGIQAGANFATQKFEDNDGIDIKSKVGLVIGALADIDFGSSISFRPELNFIQKGFKFEEDGYKLTLNLNYIELSPNFVYNTDAGMGKFFFGLGPSFGFGLSGNTKEKEDGEDEVEEDINFGDAEEEVKGFDFGLNGLVGYKMASGVFLTAGYNLGLANLSNVDDEDVKNRGFSIKLGYMFGSGNAAK